MTWSGTSVNVDKQPTINTSTTYASTSTFAHGWNGGSCANAHDTIDVTSMVRGWNNGEIPDLGIVLRAVSETNPDYYKGFCSMNVAAPENNTVCNTNYNDANGNSRAPTLSITYNTPPAQAKNLSAEPAANCVEGTTRPFVNTRTPFLRASANDLDEEPTKLEFEVIPTDGSHAPVTGTSAYLPAALSAIK
jgi:hypothetical protein